MTLDLAGPPCGCGNRGCLEALISVPAIEARYAAAAGLSSGKSFKALPGAALSGDPSAQRLLHETSQYLGAGLVNVINLFDPNRIVLGGPLVRAWPELTSQVTAQVRGRLYRFAAQTVSISASELGTDASMLGATSLVIERVYRHPHLLAAVGRRPL